MEVGSVWTGVTRLLLLAGFVACGGNTVTPAATEGNPASTGGATQSGASSGGTTSAGSTQGGTGTTDVGGTAPDPVDSAGAAGNPAEPYECGDRPHASAQNEFGFSLREAFMLLGCTEANSHLCLTVQGQCPNQGAPEFEDKGHVAKETFEVGGEVGRLYVARIRVSGIVSAKYYTGGVRDRGEDFSNADAPDGTDTFHRGGAPIPSSHDVYKITVRNPDGSELAHYYLNSFPQASGYEVHRTFPILYEKDIELPGGGSVEYMLQDSNCRAVNNCGPGDNGSMCPAARLLPGEPGVAVPQIWQGQSINSSFNVVNGASQPFHAAIVRLTLLSIHEKSSGTDCTRL